MRRGLILLALIAAGEAVFFLPFVLARVFRPTLLDVFGITNLELGTAFSLYGVVAMVAYFAGGPLADRFSARTWMQTHGNLHHAIVVQKTTMFVLLAFLVGVAAFNLVSTLVMAVGQRGADIAILKTMGAATGSLMGGFVVLGTLIGGIGIAVGLAAGSAGALALPGLVAWVGVALDSDLMSRYFINYLPVDVRASDLVAIGGTAFALCLLSTAPPARRAAGLLPREVLAHE